MSDLVGWLGNHFSPMWFGVGAVGTSLILAGVALYRGYRKEKDVNNSG